VPQDGLGYTGTNDNPSGTNGPDIRNAGIICDGSGTDNTAQTDSVVGNISFYAEQSRNNPDFVCGSGGRICEEEADVMLVIDNSGSVSEAALDTMKDAANAFVTALAPSTTTAHIGVVSFNSSATEVLGLSDDVDAITTAINGIPTSGALTNLEDGIEVAQAALVAGRGGVAKFMVIITDGEPTEDNGGSGTPAEEAEGAATDAKNAGTEIFAVGVAISNANADFMRDDIVSAPSANHYFDAADFDDLEAILEDLVDCPLNGNNL
jgi:Mg-chelatase subunit ChlD